MFAPIVALLPQVKANRLRALAVTSAKRSPAAPDIPTITEAALPGYDISSWFGIFAPARTPTATVDKLYRETAQVLNQPEVRARFASEGAEPVGNSPQEFAAYVRAEYAKYAKVVKDSGARVD